MDEENARVSPNDPKLLVADLEELPEGTYTIAWRVTSLDGHPISGQRGFVVDPSAGAEGVGEPIEPIERSAKQEESDPAWGITRAALLGILLIGALAAAGFVVLRRR